MVARQSLGARIRFASVELLCWRCALKLNRQHKPIRQQPTIVVQENPRKHGAQRASQDPLPAEGVVTHLDSLSGPVKKNRANSIQSSRSSKYIALGESVAYNFGDSKNGSSLNPIPKIVTHGGSYLSLRKGGRYYSTSAVGGASRSGPFPCLTCLHS